MAITRSISMHRWKSFEVEDTEKWETNYDMEEMSCKEITTVIDQYNDMKTCNIKECKEYEEAKETYNSLVCEYKRLEVYIIDWEAQVEEIENK